jgi:hypothetical protein
MSDIYIYVRIYEILLFLASLYSDVAHPITLVKWTPLFWRLNIEVESICTWFWGYRQTTASEVCSVREADYVVARFAASLRTSAPSSRIIA